MAVRDVVLADSPFFYSRMGDASATQQDETAGNHDVSLTGATHSVAGAPFGDPDKAVSFDGINDFGAVTIDLTDTAVFTVAFWLLWDVYGTDFHLAVEFGDSSVGTHIIPNGPGGVFYGQMFDASGANSAVLNSRPSVGVWHHYAWVFDRAAAAANQVIPYVDGVAVGYSKGASFNHTGNNATTALWVMSRGGASLFGGGDMDELAVYKSALSAARILAHFNAGRTVFLAETVTPSDAQTKRPVQGRADSVTASDAQAKAVGKPQAETPPLADAIAKSAGKPQADTVGLADAAGKAIGPATFAESVALSEAIAKAVGLGKGEVVALDDATAKAIGRLSADSTVLSDQALDAVGITLPDSVMLADSISRVWVAGLSVSDTATLADGLAKTPGLVQTDPLALLDLVAKATRRDLSEAVALADALANAVELQVADAATLQDFFEDLLNGGILRVTISDLLPLLDAIRRELGSADTGRSDVGSLGRADHGSRGRADRGAYY